MAALTSCPECGAVWPDGQTCQDFFDMMLAWEWEDTERWSVHNLMALGYHLQHPSLYSPETLAGGIQLMLDFVEGGLTTEQARQQMRSTVDSGKRKFKITGTPEHHGEYKVPVQWTMRAGDVIAAGADNYPASVRAWARSICDALKASGNG